MAANVLTVTPKRKIRVRGVALPIEHGSWGFLFEPLVAGIAVAPSLAGIWIGVLFIGAFLLRRPLQIWLAGGRGEQTSVALKFIFLYGSIAGIGLAGSLVFAPVKSLLPLALIFPVAIYQIYCDVSRKNRQLLPELTGAIAISSSAAVIVLAGGWNPGAAIALWGIFIARLIPSILYVRNRLRLEKGKVFSIIPVIALHFAALGAIGILAGSGLSSKLTVAVFVILLGRSLLGLSPYRRKLKAVKIGILEVFYGVVVVLSVIAGHYLQI